MVSHGSGAGLRADVQLRKDRLSWPGCRGAGGSCATVVLAEPAELSDGLLLVAGRTSCRVAMLPCGALGDVENLLAPLSGGRGSVRLAGALRLGWLALVLRPASNV